MKQNREMTGTRNRAVFLDRDDTIAKYLDGSRAHPDFVAKNLLEAAQWIVCSFDQTTESLSVSKQVCGKQC
jgi:hypothetical protein